jgi:hypothetical protein
MHAEVKEERANGDATELWWFTSPSRYHWQQGAARMISLDTRRGMSYSQTVLPRASCTRVGHCTPDRRWCGAFERVRNMEVVEPARVRFSLRVPCGTGRDAQLD